jgi:hypothetical protein
VGHGSTVAARVSKGMFVATAAGVLSECNFTKRILHATGIQTPLGEVIIAEALSAGRAVLAGPSINSQVSALCEFFLRTLGAKHVLIDGAAGRRTFAEAADAIILCAGQSGGWAAECEHFSLLCCLPLFSGQKAVSVDGALTDEILEEIDTDIVVPSMSKIFASSTRLGIFLSSGHKLYVRTAANLAAIAVCQKELFLAIKSRRIAAPAFLLEESR